MKGRPMLAHEQVAADSRACLERAMTTDLEPLARTVVTGMLWDVRYARRFESMSGEVASRGEWDEAERRLQADLDRRPTRLPRSR